MAGSSYHLIYTKNIKEKQKKGFAFDYRYCSITIITLTRAYMWVYRIEFSGEPSKQHESSAVNLKDSESNHCLEEGFKR